MKKKIPSCRIVFLSCFMCMLKSPVSSLSSTILGYPAILPDWQFLLTEISLFKSLSNKKTCSQQTLFCWCSFSYQPVTGPKISRFFQATLLSDSVPVFGLSASINKSSLNLKRGHFRLLSSQAMAPMRTGITRSRPLVLQPYPCSECKRFYGRSAVDMTLFMGAHNQVLMFARSVAIMYLCRVFSCVSFDYWHTSATLGVSQNGCCLTTAHWPIAVFVFRGC